MLLVYRSMISTSSLYDSGLSTLITTSKITIHIGLPLPWLVEEVVVASVLLLSLVFAALLLSALAVEGVAVGREMVAVVGEVETAVVCCPALAARASSAEPSKPRMLDIAGSTSPA